MLTLKGNMESPGFTEAFHVGSMLIGEPPNAVSGWGDGNGNEIHCFHTKNGKEHLKLFDI